VTQVEVTCITYTAVIIHKICGVIKYFPDYFSVTTTPTSHQCCTSQSRPLALHTAIWCAHIKCGLKLDKPNWRFCMNHGYIIKLHWFLGQPLKPHLITCDYLKKKTWVPLKPPLKVLPRVDMFSCCCSLSRQDTNLVAFPCKFRLLSRCSAQFQIKFPTC